MKKTIVLMTALLIITSQLHAATKFFVENLTDEELLVTAKHTNHPTSKEGLVIPPGGTGEFTKKIRGKKRFRDRFKRGLWTRICFAPNKEYNKNLLYWCRRLHKIKPRQKNFQTFLIKKNSTRVLNRRYTINPKTRVPEWLKKRYFFTALQGKEF